VESVGLGDWQDPPGFRYSRDNKLASYSSPVVARIHNADHLLCFMRPGFVSLDPQTGAVRFSYFMRSFSRESVNAARPLVIGDSIFLSAAYDVGAVLLRVRPDSAGADPVWRDEEVMQTHWSTAIALDGHVYGFSGRHEPGSSFRCVRLADGALVWQTVDVNADDEPDPKAGLGKTPPNYYGRGSAILADGKFIVLGERGLLALVEATPREFHEISRVKYRQMTYPSWTAPVLSRRRLYLRCEDAMLCLDLARPE